MIRKDWKKQQQKETSKKSETTTERDKQEVNHLHLRKNKQNQNLVKGRKGSNNILQQHNRFGSLSASSDDMELGEAPDRPRTNRNRSRSSEHSHVNSSNNRSKSPITYP